MNAIVSCCTKEGLLVRRLLEKYAQYQEQVAQLRAREGEGEEHEEEMEDILTPDEKNTAENVKKTINKYVYLNWSYEQLLS